MSTVAKILIVVNLILAGAFLASASNFLGQQENWKFRHDKTQASLQNEIATWKGKHQQVTGEMARLEEQARDTRDLNTKLQTENRTFRSQVDLVTAQQAQTSDQLTRAALSLEKAQETIQAQRQMIDSLQNERNTNLDQVRTALAAKEAAVRNLNEKSIQMETLLAEKQSLESRIEDLKQDINSLRLTTENALALLPEGAANVPLEQPALNGQVLAVDGGLAVISLGEEDEVRPGHRFMVSRGNQYVGMIEITDVEARKAAGRAVQELTRQPIQRGDRVSTR